MKESKEKLKVEIPALFEEKKSINEKIEELNFKKKEVIDEYYQRKRDFNEQKRQIKYIEWATKIQDRLKEQEE